jgi:glycosyltransferase involved in cell wall biosynthesis
MRVGYETTGLQLDATGTARAIRSLRAELASRVDLVELAHPPGRGGRIARGLARELWWFPAGLGRAVKRANVELLHCPAPLAPLRARVPFVVTLYDTAGFDHPEWLTRENALHQRLVLAPALRRAARVITSTEFARERIAAHARVPAARIDVVPLGIDPVFAPGPVDEAALRDLGVEQPYVLAVGTLQPRKNLETALAAFERVDDPALRLVVAGSRGWSDDELVQRVRASPAAERIVLTGRVSDEQLAALYRGADCLVYPSRYEGFGLPPLEAMACGTPVVAANATSLPEVLGDAALLVDPLDADALAAAIADARTRREELSEHGRAHATTFTWSRSADGVVAAYEAALAA